MSSGATSNYNFPYPIQTDPVNVAGDIQQLATALDNAINEIVQDASASVWIGGTFSNGLQEPVYNSSTNKMSMSLSQDLRSTASPSFVTLNLTQATGTAPFTVVSTTAVTNLNADLLDGQHGTYYAPINSPAFTGIPTVPTASVDTNTTQVATTAYVIGQGYAKLTSPTFVTNITTPSIIASSSSALYRSTNSGLLRMWGGTSGSGGGIDLYGGTNANYANQVMINASIHSFRDISGSTYFTITSASATSYVPFVTSAATTGNTSMRIPHGTAPSAPTNGDIWTTESGLFARINGTTQQYAKLSSPAFSDTPTSTTASVDTNTTQIATTAYVINQEYEKASIVQKTSTISRANVAINAFCSDQSTTMATLNNSFGYSMAFITLMVHSPITVSNFTIVGYGASASVTNGRFGLYSFHPSNNTCTLLAESANDTTLLSNASPARITRSFNGARSLPTQITLQPGTLYAVAILLYGNTTQPSLRIANIGGGLSDISFDTSVSPNLIYGGTVSGVQSDLPATFTPISDYSSKTFWARLS